MKKLISLVLVVAMVATLVVGCFGTSFATNEESAVLATGTYKVTVKDDLDNLGMGYFNIYADESMDEVKDFVIITSEDYGYIYYDANTSDYVLYENVDLEYVSAEDIGLSGHHVYSLDNYNTFEDIEDTNNVLADLSDFT